MTPSRTSSGVASRRFATTPQPLAAACLATALLTGCASLQQSQPREGAEQPPLPAAWAATAAQPATAGPASATSLASWWHRFGDETLSALVARALDAATDVQVARARLRQARAARELAAAALAPTLSAGGSAQLNATEGRAATRQYRAAFDAAWEADVWGGASAGLGAASADLEASAATLGQTQVALAAEVAATYIDLRSAQARRATLADSLSSQEHTLRIVQWREEAGLVTRLDVEQQRTAVAQTRAQLPALQTAIEQALNALAVLTGRAPGALHASLSSPAPVPAAPADLVLAIPAAVLSQRPDVQAAEARIRAAAARVDQLDAQRLPSLQLSGSIGLNALSLSALGSGAGFATLLASVRLPVFDGGQLAARVRAQEAALDEARGNHRATVLAALKEVEDALVALRGAREQLQSLQAAADSARRAAGLAEQRYASGLADITSVLLTQRTLLSAEDALTGTAATLASQHVRLYKALGGGWPPTTNTTAAAQPRDDKQ